MDMALLGQVSPRVFRSSERLKTSLSGFERSLLPDSRKILPGLLCGLLADVAHQVVDVVLHSLLARSHADVNQAQVGCHGAVLFARLPGNRVPIWFRIHD